ncbi:hypothetical protein ACH4YO_07905 [Streptomyces noursei]|uniref:hypothetical protein n=1 Tax=Streptomyces noursei TaxID=1971 RepID=UPI0033FF18F4
MMKATPRASFVVGVESGLNDEKADGIAKITNVLLKGMPDSPVKISFQRHFTYQDERPTVLFSVTC